MAGFSDQTTGPDDVRVVPPPAVMVVVDIGGGLLVGDATGRQQRGSVVAGLAPVGAAGRGPQNFECLQMRLSPVAAHAVLGACAELSGTVVGLDDLWGREAVRFQEQLLAAASWPDRFAIAEAVLARRQETSRAVDHVQRMTYRSFTATMRAYWDYLRQRSIPDRIAGLGLPVLVIFGADDRRWHSASAAAYRDVPGARVELLPGVGHTPMVEDPQPTAKLLLDFAAEVASS